MRIDTMPRSFHMIRFYQDYKEQLEKDNQKNKNSKTKGPLAFFLFYCYVIFWGYVFWMPPLNYLN